MAKTVDMVCQTGPISGKDFATVYEQRMTGEGDPHWARQLQRMACEECRMDMAPASMAAQIHTKNDRSGRYWTLL